MVLMHCFVGVGILAFALSASVAQAQTPQKIRLGHSQATEEPLWLMDTKGGVTPNRGKAYEAEFIPFRSASDRFKAYEAGELDCGTGTASSLIFAAANGVKFKVLASISQESEKGALSEFYVLDSSPIRTVRDLKDKRIALNGYKSGTELWVRAALLKAGMNPDRDARYSIVPFPQMATSLRAGQVDLIMLVEPFLSAETKKGGIRRLFTSREGMAFDEDLQTLYCGEAILAKNPAAVRAFLADYVATLRSYLANLKEARGHLVDAKKVRMDREAFLDLPDYYRDPSGRVSVDDWGKLQDAMIAVGFMQANQKIDTRTIIDMSYLPPAR